ncbi:hypothetical protein V1286_006669 [Bradyrhizobium algeriense]|uniref:ABC-three component systems C-terminal domain-containing protein n=1 Tax=Bradyrhizobium algeriense TaxID=634784 RepID=A0ABU8BKP4_9BRAD
MNVVAKAVKHAAPGPYLGFALQPVRLCYHLLTCPKDARVSLEYLDDVAIHNPDGSVTLEQTKSALKQNPLSDWAADLWKTIANWLNSASNNTIVPHHSQFRLYVTPLRTGEWAQALSSANSAGEVADLVEKIKAKYAKKKLACDPYLQRFFDAPENDRVAIVTRFSVVSEDDPIEALRTLIKATVAPDIVDILCHSAIGMAKEQADKLIRDGKPALIDGNTFKANFISFVKKNNLPGLLTSFASAPAQDEVAAVLSTHPTFIRQLEIIKTSQEDRVRAVSDLLRTSADKSVWAETGQVFEASLRDWDDDLVRRHALICGEISDVYSEKDPQFRGRQSYRRCAQLQAPLDGRAVPAHFVHGCFNALADSMQIGWHPDYKSLLVEDS